MSDFDLQDVCPQLIWDGKNKSTICANCNKPLGDGAIWYVNGDGFCNEDCMNAYERRCKYGLEIQKALDEHIPALYMDTDMNKLPFPMKAERVLRWRYNPKGILMFGESGTGKSRAMFMLIRKLIEDYLIGITAITLKVFASGSLRYEFESSYKTKNSQAFMDSAQRVGLLAIDDFGKDKFTDAYESAIFNIMEYRTSHKLPTLITTNYSGDSLRAKFTDATNYEPFRRRLVEFNSSIFFGNK